MKKQNTTRVKRVKRKVTTKRITPEFNQMLEQVTNTADFAIRRNMVLTLTKLAQTSDEAAFAQQLENIHEPLTLLQHIRSFRASKADAQS